MAAKAQNDWTILPNAPSRITRMRGRSGISRRRMGPQPMLRDVEPPGDPHTPEAAYMIQQPLQPRGARRVPDDAHMQSDRQHARLQPAFAVKKIECIAAIGEEIICGREDPAPELGVIR